MTEYVNYSNERRHGMPEISYNRVTFDSFVELADLRKTDKRFNPGVSLHYDGSDLCGRVDIRFGYNIEKGVCEEFIELAGKTLKLF